MIQVDDELMHSVDAASGHMTYAARVVLQDLRVSSSSSKCVCHIAATTGIAERGLYRVISGLLAKSLVRIVPIETPELISRMVADVLTREYENHSDENKARAWYAMFQALGKMEQAPVFEVGITPEGKQALSKELAVAFVPA